jgi:hypothetical protein
MFEGKPKIESDSMFNKYQMTKMFVSIMVIIFLIIFGIQFAFLLRINTL